MGASYGTRAFLTMVLFFAATFSLSFFKTMSNEVSCNEKDKQSLLSLKRGLTDPFNFSHPSLAKKIAVDGMVSVVITKPVESQSST